MSAQDEKQNLMPEPDMEIPKIEIEIAVKVVRKVTEGEFRLLPPEARHPVLAGDSLLKISGLVVSNEQYQDLAKAITRAAGLRGSESDMQIPKPFTIRKMALFPADSDAVAGQAAEYCYVVEGVYDRVAFYIGEPCSHFEACQERERRNADVARGWHARGAAMKSDLGPDAQGME